MPSPNEELARRGFDAFARGNLEESLSLLDPEIEWHIAFRLPDMPPDLRVARGRDQVREVMETFRGGWEWLTVEVEEILHDEGDLVLLRARFRGRGAGSGIEVDRIIFYLQRIRDGRLAMMRPFESLDEARRAAGLAE